MRKTVMVGAFIARILLQWFAIVGAQPNQVQEGLYKESRLLGFERSWSGGAVIKTGDDNDRRKQENSRHLDDQGHAT